MSDKTKYTEVVKCGHCGNRAPMKLLATHSQADQLDEYDNYVGACGEIFELLECPACEKLVLRQYFWQDGMESHEVVHETLYPREGRIPVGLPEPIHRGYEAALRVRSIDGNAYAVLIGRVVEMVTTDRGATGRYLNDRLKDLASRGEIPAKLVEVAESIKQFRNVGAHATLGDLSPVEAAILEDLCRGLLEYVYSAPYWVAQAEKCLKSCEDKKGAP